MEEESEACVAMSLKQPLYDMWVGDGVGEFVGCMVGVLVGVPVGCEVGIVVGAGE
jgi:hypothetical protein